MKQILIEIDDDTARRLAKVASPRSRKRSEFIRAAIRKALWEIEEQHTRHAYLKDTDQEPVYFDPEAWEQ